MRCLWSLQIVVQSSLYCILTVLDNLHCLWLPPHPLNSRHLIHDGIYSTRVTHSPMQPPTPPSPMIFFFQIRGYCDLLLGVNVDQWTFLGSHLVLQLCILNYTVCQPQSETVISLVTSLGTIHTQIMIFLNHLYWSHKNCNNFTLKNYFCEYFFWITYI